MLAVLPRLDIELSSGKRDPSLDVHFLVYILVSMYYISTHSTDEQIIKSTDFL